MQKKSDDKSPVNILQWRGFVIKSDKTLSNNLGIKFEKLLFVSPSAYSLFEGATCDGDMELIINNMKWRVAVGFKDKKQLKPKS